uniref:NAD(FAD)-utilizing dehydrogenase n=1 Tax=uncultured bacterium Contig87 TaxID=1393621 RepID=W0FQR8_9BACT|nr:NAD(FAD)-utilizing dehydrogenase [uncultured bacterium Contig87]
MPDVLVIGGGAAGMAAALFAARAGAAVTLLEHNEKLGKKVYITGKGRCNLTNDCTLDEFLAQVPRNPRFLYSALSFFSPRDMMSLLEGAGCPVTVQRGRRVFPSSEKASDVTKALASLLRESGVRVLLNTEVRSLPAEGGRVLGAELRDGRLLSADAVILACGGLSYPSTGSTGDGFRIARSLGHTVLSPFPVLVGLETKEDWPRTLQGLSLRNVTLTLSSGKKRLYSELGELLFTHFGVSGPLVLEASCHLPETAEDAALSIDLKPGLNRDQLDARLRRDFQENGSKQLRNVLPGLLPARLAECFPALCGLPASLLCNQVTAPQRERLLVTLKALPLTVRSPRPLDEAVVTRGGVSVKEIEPGTMRSKKYPNLFFAGEMIDVDAHTGGYNLQIAWSTGALAGHSAAAASF